MGEGISVAGELCPACQGGRTGERTLSVSRREGSLVWTCHRDSCGFSGREQGRFSDGITATTKTSCRGFVGRQAVRESTSISDEVANYLSESYGLEHPAIIQRSGIAWSSQENRLVLPVYNPLGECTGAVLRSLSGATPKAVSHTEELAMAWYMKRGSSQLIIVEDQLSAIRASEYMNAVALLGTNLNEQRAYEIRKQKFSQVFIALDADAIKQQTKLVLQHRGLLRLIPLILKKDIKNHSHEELQEFISESGIRN
ncbi:hypothetical protein [Xanthomonas phage DES1]|nr:hypothetical protein [Xanthomonas phage DES1]